MILLAFSAALAVVAVPLVGSSAATWIFASSQLVLLVDQWRRKQVTGVGGFVFMSFLFFGMRPLYLVSESDYALFSGLFHVNVGLIEVNESMAWATFGLLAFCCGALLRRMVKMRPNKWSRLLEASSSQLASGKMATVMLLYQVATLPIMLSLASSGRALYGAAGGAYAYDLPVPLQSGHIVAIVIILERYLKENSSKRLIQLLVSGALFLYFTWLMREVSMFRGFYIAGIMIAGIAVISRIKRRVSLAWLIVPVVLLQPPFKMLGQQRYMANDEIAAQSWIESAFGKDSVLGAYWHFYDSAGDMNIFDTFVAARQADVSTRPYALSWLYVPVHFVPRAVWASKPARGVLQDLSFMNGAPYCPGIAGFFQLDGGDIWMVGCMFVLGFLIAWLDRRVLSLPRGYLRCCLIGIVAVNAMFLTRFFLWQYFYQLMYAIIPCIILVRFFKRSKKVRQVGKGMNAESIESRDELPVPQHP